MNIWNIIIKHNESDDFYINSSEGENNLIFPINTTSGESDFLSTSVFSDLKSGNFLPKNNTFDLLNLGLCVYTIDQIISRSRYGYQGWSRHLKIYIPVNDVLIWNNVKDELEILLSFLSGDKWEFYFRQVKEIRNITYPLKTNTQNFDTVSLFSGGLDSYIEAINLLEEKKKVVFVSHYKSGSESPTQTELYNELELRYGNAAFTKYKFRVQPNQKHTEVFKEDTSRARSFLFLTLGLTIANSLGDDVKFIVPENGLISLNIPLTGTRLSSHSTRTTHPFYLDIFKKILKKIGINNPMSNPFQFFTKGEMMVNCNNPIFLKSTYGKTLSCSHPDNSRFTKGQKPGIHCGYCVPCIIRRASEQKFNASETEYAPKNIDVLKKSGRDIRAFKLAIERKSDYKKHKLVLELLKSGPLPFDNKKELDDYIGVYERGMEEVSNYFNK